MTHKRQCKLAKFLYTITLSSVHQFVSAPVHVPIYTHTYIDTHFSEHFHSHIHCVMLEEGCLNVTLIILLAASNRSVGHCILRSLVHHSETKDIPKTTQFTSSDYRSLIKYFLQNYIPTLK